MSFKTRILSNTRLSWRCPKSRRHSANWQSMVLEPGKLFIVGDPKQSIYAFRRADMEAFDRVVQKIEADGGLFTI